MRSSTGIQWTTLRVTKCAPQYSRRDIPLRFPGRCISRVLCIDSSNRDNKFLVAAEGSADRGFHIREYRVTLKIAAWLSTLLHGGQAWLSTLTDASHHDFAALSPYHYSRLMSILSDPWLLYFCYSGWAIAYATNVNPLREYGRRSTIVPRWRIHKNVRRLSNESRKILQVICANISSFLLALRARSLSLSLSLSFFVISR